MLVIPKSVSYSKLETILFATFEVPMFDFSCSKLVLSRFAFTKFVFLMCRSSNPLPKNLTSLKYQHLVVYHHQKDINVIMAFFKNVVLTTKAFS
jgi:hypothetical protein